MADSQYPYPPDRFDDEADAASFHGAHRAEEPFWRQNLVYIVIIGAAFVTLLVLLFLIGGMGGGSDDRADEPTTAAAETTAPSEASDAGGEAEEATEEPAPEADKSVAVLVVNGAGINGLAGSWQTYLEGDGWESIEVTTGDNIQQEPVVFYRDEADAATAEALAEVVGADGATQSDEYDSPVTIVVVSDPPSGDGSDEG
ncbi:LytR C-terminal domain-containing protein [Brachybacterium sp. DNPG3]